MRELLEVLDTLFCFRGAGIIRGRELLEVIRYFFFFQLLLATYLKNFKACTFAIQVQSNSITNDEFEAQEKILSGIAYSEYWDFCDNRNSCEELPAYNQIDIKVCYCSGYLRKEAYVPTIVLPLDNMDSLSI